MKPVSFDFARAASLDEACALLAGAEGEARPLAGGQSLGPLLNLRLARPALLVDISRIAALRAVSEDEDGLTLGALTTHAAIEDGAVPDCANGLLRRVASGIAYRAVRNCGTLGGSLAHADPAADWPPVMIALDAVLRLHGPAGGREVAVSEFATDAFTTALARGEVLTEIRLPRLSPAARWGHCKICVKPGEFAESLAVALRDDGRGVARAVLAGASRPPVRLAAVAALIAEAPRWSEALDATIRAAVEDEIAAAGFCDPQDRYLVNLHRTAVSRAAREALA